MTHAVLKALADARLITTSEDSAEVAHEALIREWPTLRGWLEEQYPNFTSFGGAGMAGFGSSIPPAGTILDFGGNTPPTGFVLCNGVAYDKTLPAYKKLFDAIGYNFGGAGNSFNVPDLQGRMAVGMA